MLAGGRSGITRRRSGEEMCCMGETQYHITHHHLSLFTIKITHSNLSSHHAKGNMLNVHTRSELLLLRLIPGKILFPVLELLGCFSWSMLTRRTGLLNLYCLPNILISTAYQRCKTKDYTSNYTVHITTSFFKQQWRTLL